MEYSEFKEYLTRNAIPLKEDEERLIADNRFEISKTVECMIVFLADSVDFPYELELLKKAIKLAETPLDERNEEKKYYLKHRFINNSSTRQYINFIKTEEVILSDSGEDQIHKTKFTKSEIREMLEKFETNFNDFELIEVED